MRLELWQIALALIVTATSFTWFGYFVCALGTTSLAAEATTRLGNIDVETQMAYDDGIREGRRRERQEAIAS